MRALLALLALSLLSPVALAQGMTEGMTEGMAEAGAQMPAATTPEADAGPPAEGLRILDARGLDLGAFLWEARIIAVMADTPNDPAFIRQMRDIEAAAQDLYERDVVVLFDADPGSTSELRQRLRPRGFMVAIIEKDGSIAQRRPAPRDVRELSAMIDRFPLRRQEMLERMPAGR